MRDPHQALPAQFQESAASEFPSESGDKLQPTGWFFWGIFRRNLWRILLFAAVTGGIAALYTTRLPDTYQASSWIRVDDQRMNVAGIEKVGVGNQITTEMEMLRSRSLAEQVIQKLG